MTDCDYHEGVDASVVLHCAACGFVVARCAECEEKNHQKAKHRMMSHMMASFCVVRSSGNRLPNKEFR